MLRFGSKLSVVPLPALFLAAALLARPCAAAGPLGPDGSPITTSDFAIDVFGGPVLGGSRMSGLGGAYTAIAEGVDGNLQNPAAPAVRPFYSVSQVEYWPAFGFTLPALSELDYFNTGERNPEERLPSSFLYLMPAVNFQWSTVGFGVTAELQQFSLPAPTESGEIVTRLATTHFQVANGFFRDQFVVGLGLRNVALSVSDETCRDEGIAACVRTEVRRRKYSFSSTGLGPELGVVLKHERLPFRVGAAYRAAVDTRPRLGAVDYSDTSGDIVITGANGEPFYVPRSVSLPWDLNLGLAFQLGRPINPPWRSTQDVAEPALRTLELEERELENARERELGAARDAAETAAVEARFAALLAKNARRQAHELRRAYLTLQQEFAALERFYVLVTASVLLSGSVPSGVGLESYFDQTIVRSGAELSVSPHFGVEAEAVPDILKLRTGGYVEPARSSGSSPRGHVTIGTDVRIATFDVFGLWPSDYVFAATLFADMAPRYATFGFGIGGWYPRHSGKVALPEHLE
jgi:hypothetical protein